MSEAFSELLRRAATDPEAAAEVEGAHTHRVPIVAARLPGLDHAWGTGLVGAASAVIHLHDTVQQLADDAPWGCRRVGTSSVTALSGGDRAMDVALGLSRRMVQGQPVAVALGHGRVIVGPGCELFGLEYDRVMRLLVFARASEILCTADGIEHIPIPDGVGSFQAPAAVVQALGHPAVVLRDYAF